MPLKEHDVAMAQSQAILAVLIKVLLPCLIRFEREGILTLSAKELLSALKHRNTKWTENTLKSLLSNPELTSVVQTLQNSII